MEWDFEDSTIIIYIVCIAFWYLNFFFIVLIPQLHLFFFLIVVFFVFVWIEGSLLLSPAQIPSSIGRMCTNSNSMAQMQSFIIKNSLSFERVLHLHTYRNVWFMANESEESCPSLPLIGLDHNGLQLNAVNILTTDFQSHGVQPWNSFFFFSFLLHH